MPFIYAHCAISLIYCGMNLVLLYEGIKAESTAHVGLLVAGYVVELHVYTDRAEQRDYTKAA